MLARAERNSTFGGSLGSNAENFDNRYELDAMMVWELRNLGFGERAAREKRSSQIQQATFTKLRIMDQVAQEVAEANAQVTLRRQQIDVAQEAIRRARDSYTRNMDRIRDGQGLPIEVLQAIQALEATERAYLRAVVDYNPAQPQLLWALGWPINAETAGQRTAIHLHRISALRQRKTHCLETISERQTILKTHPLDRIISVTHRNWSV